MFLFFFCFTPYSMMNPLDDESYRRLPCRQHLFNTIHAFLKFFSLWKFCITSVFGKQWLIRPVNSNLLFYWTVVLQLRPCHTVGVCHTVSFPSTLFFLMNRRKQKTSICPSHWLWRDRHAWSITNHFMIVTHVHSVLDTDRSWIVSTWNWSLVTASLLLPSH